VLNKQTALAAVRYAEMARDAYENPNKSTFAPAGYERDLNWWDYFKRAGFSQSQIDKIEKSGFSATIFRKNGSGEIVIAFRGTEFGSGLSDMRRDLHTDRDALASQATGQVIQYNAAAALAKYVRDQGAPVVLTGHSLGGGLASYAGSVNNLKVVTYNGARTSYMAPWNNPNQTNFITPGDAVGDPNAKYGNILGAGSLPGTSLFVQSSTDQSGLYGTTIGRHGINGIIGGLSDVARRK